MNKYFVVVGKDRIACRIKNNARKKGDSPSPKKMIRYSPKIIILIII